MTNSNPASNQSTDRKSNTSNRGFASMPPEKQRQIASKGGQAVSGNREHMAEIGRKGGEASGESRRKQSSNSDSPAPTGSSESNQD